MARDRRYVLDYHKVMARYDFDVLQATNGLVNAAYLTPRTQEILQAIEIAFPEAGIVAFQAGLDAWRETVGATGIEPTRRRP
ncbi:hypothetical protein AB0I98_41425 [Streptomyces sp. NPDC050211]|uniref:hypothetical protein n=1 Tax=Streptomyces sp. NPDC050211 TaxID=3154932 RepID=UPI00343BF1C1